MDEIRGSVVKVSPAADRSTVSRLATVAAEKLSLVLWGCKQLRLQTSRLGLRAAD